MILAFETLSTNVGKLVGPRCHISENAGKVRQRTVAFDRGGG